MDEEQKKEDVYVCVTEKCKNIAGLFDDFCNECKSVSETKNQYLHYFGD